MYDPIEVSQAASRAAREIRKGGGAGYVESGKVLTFDGNIEGKEYFADFSMVKLSDTPVTINGVVRIVQTYKGVEQELPLDTLEIRDIGGSTVVIFSDADTPACISAPENSGLALELGASGTFVPANENGWVSLIEFTETIHPIDPKFLPGVCLPVVEIADMNEITAEESAALTAAAETGMPCVIRVTLPTQNAFVPIYFIKEGVHTYMLPYSGAVITRNNDTGMWAIGAATAEVE